MGWCLPSSDHGEVGGSEVEFPDFLRSHPAERDVFVWMRFGTARGEPADERDHLDRHGIRVGEARQGAGNLKLTPELFTDFAHDRGLGGFAGLDLAAGKFPLQRQVLVRGALGHEHMTGAFDHGTNHGNGC